MKIQTSEPDIETLLKRIERNDINLQPDFQRGEVWSEKKKNLLVDSILRGWQVPPIHVVQRAPGAMQEVLDGQQRLSALRSFARGEFPVRGNTSPIDVKIEALDGLTYTQLPREVRREFDNFTIRLITITEFSAEEPAELFYRLNQPVYLTTAEQRNAFFGPAREQIKAAAKLVIGSRLGDPKIAGFSNARLAMDDVIAKTMLALEIGTLARKLGAKELEARYRSSEPFSGRVTEGIAKAITTLDAAVALLPEMVDAVFNKATLFTWLIIADQCVRSDVTAVQLATAFRRLISAESWIRQPSLLETKKLPTEALLVLVQNYMDRASSRVADASSVLVRHATAWAMLYDVGVVPENPLGLSVLRFVRDVSNAEAWRADSTLVESASRELGGLV